MRSPSALTALTAALVLCSGTRISGQDSCDLLSSRSSTVRVTGAAVFSYISEPVFGCEGGVTIRADSAELNDAAGFTRFIGNFEYRDSAAFMTADKADHFASSGRLIGVGNVHIIDASTGAVFEGDSTVLVGNSAQRAAGELTIVGVGRRAHAVILVAPRAPTPDSSEVPPDAMTTVTDSASGADLAGAAPDSAEVAPGPGAAESDSTRAESDSPAVVADSIPGPPGENASDTVVIPPDSAGSAQDSPVEPPGPVPVEPTDSAATPPDSALLAAEQPAAADPLPRDTTPVPYDIDADHIYLRGTGYLLATGNAELHNEEFRALSDSIEYREEEGMLFLRGAAPRIYGFGAEYTLSGDEVDLEMDGNQVAARGNAALTGSEIDLTAPEIRVLLQGGVLDRIVAMHERPSEPGFPASDGAGAGPAQDSGSVADSGRATAPSDGESMIVRTADAGEALREAAPAGETPAAGTAPAADATGPTMPGAPGDSTATQPPARPRAVAESFEIEGDSIEVEAPGEVLERVVAVGNARGESLGRDSLNTERTPDIARSDWVSGDTIIATFQSGAASRAAPEAGAGAEPVAGDTIGGYELDRLVARGQAASLYRMTPSEGGDSGEEREDPGSEGSAGAVETDPTGTAEPSSEEEAPGEEASDEQAPEAGAVADEEAPETAQPGAPEGTGEGGEGENEAAPAEEGPENCLALHYVRGDLITIFMESGEVTSVIVEGDARGVQLEPVGPRPRACPGAAPPDGTDAAPPDSTRTPPSVYTEMR